MPDDIKLFITFVKLYEKIGDQFSDFNGYHKISLMKSLIDTSSTRQVICEEVHKYFGNQSQSETNQTNQIAYKHLKKKRINLLKID